MKHNYKVTRTVFNSIYSNIAKQFKIYLDSLASDEIDEIEKDFRAKEMAFFQLETPKAPRKCLIPWQCFTT